MAFFDLDDEPELESNNVEPENMAALPVFGTSKNPEVNINGEESTRELISSTVYSRYGTDDKLIEQIFSVEGSAISGVFFNQYLERDDQPRRLDTGLDATLQNYIRIEGMKFYSQDGLQYDRDQASGLSNLSVEVQIYPGIQPQPGDIAIIAIDDGRHGMFEVENIQPLNWRQLPTHSFTLKFLDIARPHYLNNLDTKVVERWHYDDEGAKCGNPLVDTTHFSNEQEIKAYLLEIVTYYYDQFMDNETLSLSYPDKTRRIYDHATVEFMYRVVSNEYLGRHRKAIMYNVSSRECRDRIETIWDALMTGSRMWKHRACPNWELNSTSEYVSSYTTNHVGSSNYDFIMTPVDRSSVRVDNTDNQPLEPEYYVFSKAFYEEDTEKMTRVECHVAAALNGAVPKPDVIFELINEVQEKTLQEQFHVIPVLIWLLLKNL